MFKKLTPDAILPQRQTRFSAGFDVFANEDVVICAGETKLIGLGIAIDLDRCIDEYFTNHEYCQGEIVGGYVNQQELDHFMGTHFFALHIRSSLRAKGLTSLGTGIIDIDYPDEIKMVVYNPLKATQDFDDSMYPYDGMGEKGEWVDVIMFEDEYEINKGDKIGQLILLQHAGHLMPSEYTLDNERVGGFGSSGVR